MFQLDRPEYPTRLLEMFLYPQGTSKQLPMVAGIGTWRELCTPYAPGKASSESTDEDEIWADEQDRQIDMRYPS